VFVMVKSGQLTRITPGEDSQATFGDPTFGAIALGSG